MCSLAYSLFYRPIVCLIISHFVVHFCALYLGILSADRSCFAAPYGAQCECPFTDRVRVRVRDRVRDRDRRSEYNLLST